MAQITVLYPITIPLGKYCRQFESPYEICDYFDMHFSCRLNLGRCSIEKAGVLKPDSCLKLNSEDEQDV